MDRALLERHLAETLAHIALGERNIAQQRKLLAELERDGHDSVEAKKLLANFEQLQTMNLADLERVREELAAFRP